jgi:transposase InsO family protein
MEDPGEKIEDWRWEYNHLMPHSTLDDLAPQEFIKFHENIPQNSNLECSV